MRDCENAEMRDLLPDYVGGVLAGAERARVEAHLAACTACRDDAALLRGVRAVHPLPRVSAGDVARIVAALPKPARASAQTTTAAPGVVSLDAHRARRSTPRGGLPWRRVAALAAVFAGVVGVGVFGRERGSRGDVPDAVPAESIAVRPAPESVPSVGPMRGSAVPRAPETPVARSRTTEALGTLGGIASGAEEDELEALIAGLESLSGIPDVDAGDAATTEGTGGEA